jgi:hypothetical protein
MTDYFNHGMDDTRSLAARDREKVRRLKLPRCRYWYVDPRGRRWGFTTAKRMKAFVGREGWRAGMYAPDESAIMTKTKKNKKNKKNKL